MASFPGGVDSMFVYIERNLLYPQKAIVGKTEGRVVCGFWVEEDGTISRVEVFKGVSEELDEEAVRVIDIMSKWEPARRGDKKVRMRYSMPITFKLQRDINHRF